MGEARGAARDEQGHLGQTEVTNIFRATQQVMAAEVRLVICPGSKLKKLEAGAPQRRQLAGGEGRCAQPDVSLEAKRWRRGRSLAGR